MKTFFWFESKKKAENSIWLPQWKPTGLWHKWILIRFFGFATPSINKFSVIVRFPKCLNVYAFPLTLANYRGWIQAKFVCRSKIWINGWTKNAYMNRTQCITKRSLEVIACGKSHGIAKISSLLKNKKRKTILIAELILLYNWVFFYFLCESCGRKATFHI